MGLSCHVVLTLPLPRSVMILLVCLEDIMAVVSKISILLTSRKWLVLLVFLRTILIKFTGTNIIIVAIFTVH